MSNYVKPVLECISFKIEESLAAGPCTGCCEKTGDYAQLNPLTGKYHKVHLVALNYSN
jgi:hypothetical protein